MRQVRHSKARDGEMTTRGRQALVWKEGVGWVHQTPQQPAAAADDSLDSSDSSESSGEDHLASHVWHAFPHAYAEAQCGQAEGETCGGTIGMRGRR